MQRELSGELMKIDDIEYTIRTVKATDLDQLFSMLVDLVKHEGTFNRFKLTRTRLEDELFGNNADWHCLVVADSCEKLFGFCLYTFANINRAFNTSPMIQIDDLYVSPEVRNAKIGSNLIYQLALIAKNKNIGRLNVWCVKDNVQGQNFYQKIGADKIDFIDVYSIQVTNLLTLFE
ncbi:GNAT family N-acetyltransferase [Legionella oakridgensis]|uniref:Acetyltransferase n=3 Tax=Legionella oakridgensis TaxID=29423 RepID=W0BDT3_9GAMM|nr:GNAT family N-acetyltransferase [Legionella oakridgensis]AHE66841.1 acetyltransferase [Legionella oakridgensis ATCC 33761 = DSM 21215]KTD39857.1 N-acetyltransferase ats1 [Legionella oakridgensis]STY19953.1 N-acetyltransferase ats1 [Legionella longbeachae]